jgi:N-acetylglucosamine malate deacetylase 1
MANISRRAALQAASAWSTGAVMPGLASQSVKDQAAEQNRGLKVVVVGAHPDDPESSCGGTIARYSDLGHQVVVVYLTRGEAGIPGKSKSSAALIRSAEVQRACAILKARPVFVGQVDGQAEVTDKHYQEFRSLLEGEKPDVLFAPWPIDSHRDHRAASLLTYDAWEQSNRKCELYYTEVDLGGQTSNFQPTDFVDISSVVERKKEACFAHESQKPPSFYVRYHEPMQRFRGLEYGCQVAEAFVRALQGPKRCSLPR